MNGVLTSLALVLLFVLIGGYFSGSELAVLTLRDSQADRLPGRRGARVRALRADSSRFLASVQVGVTFAGFFASAYGGSTLSEPLAGLLTGFGVPAAATIAFVAVTAFISYLSLVLGELVPKRLALQRAEGFALFVAPVLDVLAKIMRPVVWLLSVSTNVFVRMLGLDPRAGGDDVTEEELRDMVSTHGELGAEERRVLTDVFGAADRQLGTVMVPRTEVEFLSASTPLADAARDVLDKPHSRYPVIGATVDDVVGVVHVRDVFTAALRGDAARTVADITRPVPLLPGSKPVLAALTEMRDNRTHLAVVVDEYGGTDGIVTMEDILEELVGEIEDEYDPAATRQDGRDSTEFDGLLHRDELAEATGVALPDGPYETLAGFVQTALGRIPVAGDVVDAHGHRFTVVEMDGRRVARVRIAPRPPVPEGTAADADADGAAGPGRGPAVAPER